MLKNCFYGYFVQVTSCYGLLSINNIDVPVATGRWVLMTFLPGFIHAGFQARNSVADIKVL